MENYNITRRAFLKIATLGALGIHYTTNGDSFEAPKSKVVKVTGHGVIEGRASPAPTVVEKMIESGLVAFTGKKDITEAWKSIVSPSDIVGIKINPIGGRKLSTNPEVVNAIVKGLMLTGVKENNIIVWDKEEKYLLEAGYPINTSERGVRCYATEPTAGYDKDVFYETDEDEPGLREEDDCKSLFSNIVTKHVTAIINVPVMKDHPVTGVTLCMKNITFGSVNNAPRFHPDPFYGDPMMAEVYSHPMLRSKVRLHILDCLQACFAGGPAYMTPNTMWNEEAVFIGTDPVAIDQIGLEIIEKKRLENKFTSIAHRARYIKGAAQLGLGTNDKNRIELMELVV
ncbi:MAG TPA: DUF362 domain-containing protein [Candidatus Brocadiia bacterium]|nr:DUF362 domain-containing protein [Candidatus Brocadiales bacterium]